jgi:hypothetical protein
VQILEPQNSPAVQQGHELNSAAGSVDAIGELS